MRKALKRIYKRIMSYVPAPLPVGMSEYKKFMDDIRDLAGNYADETSMKFAISSMLIHAPHDTDRLSKQYFLKRLRKSAANQIASQVFQDIKTEQEARQKEVVAADTTNNPVESANEQEQKN